MNIFSQIFPTDGSNSSDHNITEVEISFKMTSLIDIMAILFGLPIQSYVIWLIVTGTGNGLESEFFCLNLAVCEMLLCVESVFCLLDYKFPILWAAVEFLDGLSITGRPLFQCVICVERYLAVVHPVTFLKYKPLRYKLMCSVFVWVVGFVTCGVYITTTLLSLTTLYYSFFFAQFVLFFSFQLFCCLAVLRALKQSGPGEKGRERNEENHIKRRAFYLILITNVITDTLYVPYVMCVVPELISGYNNETVYFVSSVSFALTSLVQPVAFLYRVRKLPFMKCQ